jgi:hypothetical protein
VPRLRLTLLLLLFAPFARPEPIRVRAVRVGLSPQRPAVERVGALAFRGGLMLSSPDKRFGGLSGLLVSKDGSRLRAVSDEGSWLEARLLYDARGFLAGLADTQLGPLRDTEGVPLKHKAWQDAESLTTLPDGSLVVGFERQHRLWRFRGERPFDAAAEAFTVPPTLARMPENGGLEAIAALPDGRFFALAEQALDESANLRGFLLQAGRWSPVAYRVLDTPVPSDAAALLSGDVLVLERSFSPVQGVRARLRRIEARTLEPGALLDPPVLAEFTPPLALDNFEGLAVREEKGETLVYLVSDDNFSRIQRTLLFMFALQEAPAR